MAKELAETLLKTSLWRRSSSFVRVATSCLSMFLNSIFFLSSFRSSFFFSLRCTLQQILRHFLFLFFTMAGIYKYCPKIVKEFCISNQPKKYNFETVNYLPSMNQITICNQNMNLISNLKYISFTITLHNFSILAIVFF